MSTPPSITHRTAPPLRERLKEIIAVYFKFGYIAFGGPNAHIAILYDEIVIKRQWILIEQFAELVAISQALPGPASAKVAYCVALIRSGLLCAVVAFFLWSLPGAIVMTIAGALIGGIKGDIPLWATRLEQGLALAAIGIVALAGYRMSTTLATDKLTRTVALLAGGASALYAAPWLMPTVMITGGIVSYITDGYLAPAFSNWKAKRKAKQQDAQAADGPYNLEQGTTAEHEYGTRLRTSSQLVADNVHRGLEDESAARNDIDDRLRDRRQSAASTESRLPTLKASSEQRTYAYSRRSGLVCFLVFLTLLIASILVRVLSSVTTRATYLQLASTFYFVGSIIFGGGNVVVPLLKSYTVDVGWMTDQQFLVGLALVQSLPGPNFNFSCFIGAVAMANANENTVLGAILSFVAIYFPGLILKNAIVPFWQYFRDRPAVRMVFRGVNACALGFVFSACWLLWKQTTAVGGSNDYHAVIVTTSFVAAGYLGLPVPLTIILGGAMGAIEFAIVDRHK